MKGVFVIVEGIDGCGKASAVDALAGWAKKKGSRIFDLRQYQKKYNRYPDIEELEGYGAVVSCEPPYSGKGKVLRDILLPDENADVFEVADYFAESRMEQMKFLLLCIEQGMFVFQERSVASSLVYQPVQGGISHEEIAGLPGNVFFFKHQANLMIVIDVNAETAVKRLQAREKKDNIPFEKLDFLKRIAPRYHAEFLAQIFRKAGICIEYIENNNISEEEMRRKVVGTFEKFIASHCPDLNP